MRRADIRAVVADSGVALTTADVLAGLLVAGAGIDPGIVVASACLALAAPAARALVASRLRDVRAALLFSALVAAAIALGGDARPRLVAAALAAVTLLGPALAATRAGPGAAAMRRALHAGLGLAAATRTLQLGAVLAGPAFLWLYVSDVESLARTPDDERARARARGELAKNMTMTGGLCGVALGMFHAPPGAWIGLVALAAAAVAVLRPLWRGAAPAGVVARALCLTPLLDATIACSLGVPAGSALAVAALAAPAWALLRWRDESGG